MGVKSPTKAAANSSASATSKRKSANVQSPNARMNIEKYLIPHVKTEVLEQNSNADVACGIASAAATVALDRSADGTPTVDVSVNNHCNQDISNNNSSGSIAGINSHHEEISNSVSSSNNSSTVSNCRQKENVPESEANKKQKRVRASRKKTTFKSIAGTPTSTTTTTTTTSTTTTSGNNVDIKEKFITDYFQPRRSHRRTKAEVLKSKQMIMEEKIIREDESGFDVVKYEEKGRGVISRVDLKAGDFVLEYAGDLIGLKEARQREELYARDTSVGCYMYYFQHDNRNHCIDATQESDRLGRLINHSIKGANLKTRSVTVGGKARLVFLAKRDISSGEELLYDYGDRSKLSLQSHPWLKN